MKKFLIKIFRFLAFRRSYWFYALQHLFHYTPEEEMARNALQFVVGLDGDYLEFGVWEGADFIRAYHFAQQLKLSSMRFYAFDSFSGLPEIKGTDIEQKVFKKGDFSCDVNNFKRNLVRGGVNLDKVTIVPGLFQNTLTEEIKKKLPIRKAAVIWIDCDLYESTVPILEFITDYLQNGSLIVFDDWFMFGGRPDRGEQRAFNEWLAKNPSFRAIPYRKAGWRINSFIIYEEA